MASTADAQHRAVKIVKQTNKKVKADMLEVTVRVWGIM